jgi:hypothetical protein
LGIPLLLQEALSHTTPQSESLWIDLLRQMTPQGRTDLCQSLLLGSADASLLHRFLSAFEACKLHSEEQEQIAQKMLQESLHAPVQEMALSMLHRTASRSQKLQRLASVGAWGIRIARELTGKLFQISLLTGKDLGYTRLETPRIFINPLPLLRDEPHGEMIVKALILHEIGHHLYHATPEARTLWKEAASQGLHPLLNLVADEHLERNLRARDQSFGHALKQLAAYGFQHSQREIPASALLEALGTESFAILTQSPPQIARAHGHLRIHTGTILRKLEERHACFVRFLRSLRMGLGNRHEDPLVNQAQKLFPSRFRHHQMPHLYDIAQKLRDLFGTQADLLPHLASEGMLGAHISEIIEALEGIDDRMLQAAIERELQPAQQQSLSQAPDAPQRTLNLSPHLHFNLIHRVEMLTYQSEAADRYIGQIARYSRQLRSYLEQLGLQLRHQPKRIQGHRLDQPALRNALLQGDPRLLIARKPTLHNDLFLGVLVDSSGSMSGPYLEKARLFGSLLAEATRDLHGIDTRFFGFNDQTLFDAGNSQRCALHALESAGGNNDAAALWHISRLALQSRRKAKLLVMISDGCPTECSVEALRTLVLQLSQKRRIACAQIAVRPLPTLCFPHYTEITDDDLSLATKHFGQTIARLIQQTLHL